MRAFASVVSFVSLFASTAGAATVTVGPGKAHPAPCAAFAAANDGDRIEIDAAGTYAGDVCAVTKNRLTIVGVNGRPKIDADGADAEGKAIWVVKGDDTTVENVEMTGATVGDQNGAGIRQEGTNLTVRRCYFHDNENSILSGVDPASTIVVESSEFANNGRGDGLTHNLYIGKVARLVYRFNYSHDANRGHLVKSRAAVNVIAYNRLTDGASGNSSYEVNLPSAGTSYVIGNVIEQGPSTDNSAIIDYGSEPGEWNAERELFVVNNTVVNRRPGGGVFVQINAGITTPARLINNVFFGPGTVTNQGSAVQTTNYTGDDPRFVDAVAYDFRLLEGSPLANAGTPPGTAGAMSLVPDHHYVHPGGSAGRSIAGSAIDIGAYELGGEVALLPDGGAPSAAPPGAAPPAADAGGTPPGAATPTAGSPAGEESGCGCRTTTPSGGSALAGLLFLGLSLTLLRRRRR